MYKKACGEMKMAPARRPGELRRQPRSMGFSVIGVFGAIGTWAERRRQRFALASLDDNMLCDIGLSRADVERESEKPFWTL